MIRRVSVAFAVIIFATSVIKANTIDWLKDSAGGEAITTIIPTEGRAATLRGQAFVYPYLGAGISVRASVTGWIHAADWVSELDTLYRGGDLYEAFIRYDLPGADASVSVGRIGFPFSDQHMHQLTEVGSFEHPLMSVSDEIFALRPGTGILMQSDIAGHEVSASALHRDSNWWISAEGVVWDFSTEDEGPEIIASAYMQPDPPLTQEPIFGTYSLGIRRRLTPYVSVRAEAGYEKWHSWRTFWWTRIESDYGRLFHAIQITGNGRESLVFLPSGEQIEDEVRVDVAGGYRVMRDLTIKTQLRIHWAEHDRSEWTRSTAALLGANLRF
jgi:hypothetical protein